MFLYILFISITFHSSVFVSISLISSATDRGFITFHLVLILYLYSKALLVSLIPSDRYSLLSTSFDTSLINFLFFTFFSKSSSFHSHSLCLIVIYIGTWSDMSNFSLNTMSTSLLSIRCVITMSILLFYYSPHPFLVHLYDSQHYHPAVFISFLKSLYFFALVLTFMSKYIIF